MGDRQMFPVHTAMIRYGLDGEFMKLSMRDAGPSWLAAIARGFTVA
jgi:hypothetical protein